MHAARVVPPLLLLPLFALGCGPTYKVAPVSGRVTMDNRPLANAEVRFQPTGGQDLPYSSGMTDEQGHYELQLDGNPKTPGAVVGDNQVSISMDPRKNKRLLKDAARLPGRAPGEMLPAKYNRESTLTCPVPPDGKQDANFDLKSK